MEFARTVFERLDYYQDYDLGSALVEAVVTGHGPDAGEPERIVGV